MTKVAISEGAIWRDSSAQAGRDVGTGDTTKHLAMHGLPVWPYAKIQALYPEKALSSSSLPRQTKTCSWSANFGSFGSMDQKQWSNAKVWVKWYEVLRKYFNNNHLRLWFSIVQTMIRHRGHVINKLCENNATTVKQRWFFTWQNSHKNQSHTKTLTGPNLFHNDRIIQKPFVAYSSNLWRKPLHTATPYCCEA